MLGEIWEKIRVSKEISIQEEKIDSLCSCQSTKKDLVLYLKQPSPQLSLPKLSLKALCLRQLLKFNSLNTLQKIMTGLENQENLYTEEGDLLLVKKSIH
jgi:hypothetical protein